VLYKKYNIAVRAMRVKEGACAVDALRKNRLFKEPKNAEAPFSCPVAAIFQWYRRFPD